MEQYDYESQVREDLREYIAEWKKYHEGESVAENRDEIYDSAMESDSVTGNGSGSYTLHTWKAEENLCHNMELLAEACKETCTDIGAVINDGAEACDVIIRCHILGEVFDEVLEEFADEDKEA